VIRETLSRFNFGFAGLGWHFRVAELAVIQRASKFRFSGCPDQVFSCEDR
jgi:hypothetical protein